MALHVNAEQGSFGDMLANMGGLFPPELIGPVGWQRLLALTNRLSVHVFDHRFGFEFALSDPEPAADFFAGPPYQSRLAEFYVRQGKNAPSGSVAAALGDFLAEQVRNPNAFLSRSGGDVILEYDLAGPDPDLDAPPGVFLVPQDTGAEQMRELLIDPDATVTALWTAAGYTPDDAERRHVQRIYEALPSTGFISQAGVMPGRSQRAIRLLARIYSVGEVVEMLERIQWSGFAAAAAAVLEDMMHLTRPYTGISLDVTAMGVLPRLGLELFRPVEWYELDRSGWRSLFERLMERGWCLPEKCYGMAAWPQVEHLVGKDGVYRILQTINHVKLVMDRGKVTSKAYAGIAAKKVV